MLVRFAIDPQALFEDSEPRQEKINRLLDVWRQYGVMVKMDTSSWTALPAKVSKHKWEDIRKILHLSPPVGYPVGNNSAARKRRFADLDTPEKVQSLLGQLDLLVLEPVRAQEIGLDESEFCQHVASTRSSGGFIELISRWDDIDQSCRISDAKNLHSRSISLPDTPESIWKERFELIFNHSGSVISVIDRYIVRSTQSNRSALLNFLSFLSECNGNSCEVNIFSTSGPNVDTADLRQELYHAITDANIRVKKFKKVNFYVYPDGSFDHDRRIILSNRVLEIGPGLKIFADNQDDDHATFSVKPICGKDILDCTECDVHKFANIISQMKVNCPENRRFTFIVYGPGRA